MDDLGLKEELQAFDKYDKRRRIILWSIAGIIAVSTTSFLAFQLTNAAQSEQAGSVAAKTDNKNITAQDKAKDSKNDKNQKTDTVAPSSISNEEVLAQQQANKEAQEMSHLQQSMEIENRRLRQEWFNNAIALSAKLAKINQLISTQDPEKLEEARQLEREATGDAIGLELTASQGQPDANLLAARQQAAAVAKEARAKSFNALLEADLAQNGMASAWREALNEAFNLSRKFSNFIK